MTAGDSLPTLRHQVQPAAMAVMAELLHDPNPIHLEPAAVKAAGLGERVINQGPANLGYIINMLDSAFPDFRVAKIESRYLANVRGGDVVIAGGTLLNATENRLDCETWLRLESGETAVSASAVLTRR